MVMVDALGPCGGGSEQGCGSHHLVKEIVMGLVIIVLLVEMGLWSRKKKRKQTFQI